MPKNFNFSANLQVGSGQVELAVDIVSFVEDDVHFVFAPALDITGYGSTLSEAKNSFEVNIGEFFAYTLKKGTLESELKKHGWQIKKSKKRLLFTMPEFSELVEMNEQLGELVNSHSFDKSQYHTMVPAF